VRANRRCRLRQNAPVCRPKCSDFLLPHNREPTAESITHIAIIELVINPLSGNRETLVCERRKSALKCRSRVVIVRGRIACEANVSTHHVRERRVRPFLLCNERIRIRTKQVLSRWEVDRSGELLMRAPK